MLQCVMNPNTVTLKRSNILGKLYKQCDKIGSIAVYMTDSSADPIGTAEESPNHYADAFLFHLPDAICKKLSNNNYDICVDYDFVNKNKVSDKDQVKLNHIILADKQGAESIPRRNHA